MSTFLLIFKLSKIYLCFMNLLQICNSDKKKRMSTIHATNDLLYYEMHLLPYSPFESMGISRFFFLSEAGKIQVYVRVRPFTEREKDKREVNAIEIHQEHSLVSRANREIGLQRVHVDTSAFRVVICHYNDLF